MTERQAYNDCPDEAEERRLSRVHSYVFKNSNHKLTVNGQMMSEPSWRSVRKILLENKVPRYQTTIDHTESNYDDKKGLKRHRMSASMDGLDAQLAVGDLMTGLNMPVNLPTDRVLHARPD